MSCPICDQKAANCDCTREELSQNERIEDLEEDLKTEGEAYESLADEYDKALKMNEKLQARIEQLLTKGRNRRRELRNLSKHSKLLDKCLSKMIRKDTASIARVNALEEKNSELETLVEKAILAQGIKVGDFDSIKKLFDKEVE